MISLGREIVHSYFWFKMVENYLLRNKYSLFPPNISYTTFRIWIKQDINTEQYCMRYWRDYHPRSILKASLLDHAAPQSLGCCHGGLRRRLKPSVREHLYLEAQPFPQLIVHGLFFSPFHFSSLLHPLLSTF